MVDLMEGMYMVFMNPYLDTESKLDLLAKWIIVHSCIYYELDDNVVPDKMFDDNCKQYMRLMKLPKSRPRKWAYAMKGFDGNTGFHLFKMLNMQHRQEITTIADMLIKNKIKREI